MKTEKLGGVAGGEGECGDDVAGWLVRERLVIYWFIYWLWTKTVVIDQVLL